MITQEQLKSLVHYDPDTGIFTWLQKPVNGTGRNNSAKWNKRYAGSRVGSIGKHCNKRYYSAGIMGKKMYLHRLAWLYITGNHPEDVIDHINGDTLDNRFENLRSTSKSQNQKNSQLDHRNKTGISGVWFCNRLKKYICYITSFNKRKYLGSYADFDEAVKVRRKAELEHNFHPNHNRAP